MRSKHDQVLINLNLVRSKSVSVGAKLDLHAPRLDSDTLRLTLAWRKTTPHLTNPLSVATKLDSPETKLGLIQTNLALIRTNSTSLLPETT